MPTKIAVVDDHDKMRDHLTQLLIAFGFEVVLTARNGKDLLNQLSQTTIMPDVCLLDVNMPVMNGYETAKVLVSHWKEIKILAYSTDDMTRDEMIRCGANRFIDKGCDPDELKDEIIRIANSNW